ncbi:uncharacterized protein LOC126374102 [Pectinophora gossypiella]|uniref:uncharacterized protein LOC126374102 n=1 Tax=Pectinophora gossypiella TaxID=13191 RepID=UPI00214E5F82|nr:uncharacterized protein LOC126374102 [Pectinophora gossypiella]
MVITFSLVTVFLFSSGEALFCWKCSPTDGFEKACHDPFQTKYSAPQAYALENCDDHKSQHDSYKSFCMKEKKYANGQMQVLRQCTWKRKDDNSSLCPIGPKVPGTVGGEIIFCETCDHDGCNHGTAVKLTMALLAPTLSLFLFK